MAHTEFLGGSGDDFQFVELLHHNEDALAHLLGKQCQLYVVLVLVAVADDERVAVHIDRQHRMEFWLRPCLQTEVELLAMLDDLLHHRTDLVHLDRIDDEVLGIVTIFLGVTVGAGVSSGFL